MFKISLCPHPDSTIREGELRPSQSLITALFEKVIDGLLWIFYALAHTLSLLLRDSEHQDHVFKNRMICRTHDKAKFSELWTYVQLRHDPIPLPDETKVWATVYGFTPTKTTLTPKPRSGGTCFGGSLYFFEQWFKTDKDIEELAQLFKGGIPLKGAIYQTEYETVQDVLYLGLVDMIRFAVDNYPNNQTKSQVYTKIRPLLEGIDAYLADGNKPKEGGMAEWISLWMSKNGRGELEGSVYSSLREAASYYDQKLSVDCDKTVAIFGAHELNANTLKREASPSEILQAIDTLQPGAYKISFPTYSKTGEKRDPHTVALIIQNEGFSYLYETNSGIAYIPREELQETLGRLFTYYTGFEFDEDLNACQPSGWKKISNFLNEHANPGSVVPKNCFLYEIKEESPSHQQDTIA